MKKLTRYLTIGALIGTVFVLTGCGKKTTNTGDTATPNINANTDEAPYTISNGTKQFDLQLVNKAFNYKTMTFYAGDSISVRLTENGQPVDFTFRNIPAHSTDGVFNTNIESIDPGGTYDLICQDRECGNITLTVISRNTNTDQTANANSANQVTRVEMQRLPAGTDFTPGMDMEVTTAFKTNDQFGIAVTGTFKSGDKMTYSVVDANGNTVEPQGRSSDLMNGTNGTCCYAVPSTAGAYTLKIFVGGTEMQSVPFSVTP